MLFVSSLLVCRLFSSVSVGIKELTWESFVNFFIWRENTTDLKMSTCRHFSGRFDFFQHEDEDFDKEDINAHVELFSLWCLGVHQGKVAKTRFSIAPDNGKLNGWCACLYPPTSCQALKQQPPFLPPRWIPPTSFGPSQLEFLALPKKQSTKIKSIVSS